MRPVDGRNSRAVVVSRDSTPPRHRQRPAGPVSDFLPFHDSRESLPLVYIHRGVFPDLAHAAQANLPREVIGLLYGRNWQDSRGIWTVVTRFVVARGHEAEASPGHCVLTPEGSAAIRQRAEALHPAEEPVGWAHSHTAEQQSFSQGDFQAQAKKPDQSVGLLAYRAPQGWTFTLYLGPQPVELQGKPPVVPIGPAASAAPPEAAGPESVSVSTGAGPSAGEGCLQRLATHLAGPSGPLRRPLPLACAPNRGHAPLTVHCLKGMPGDQVMWSFGDGAVSCEPNPAHTFIEPGVYLVELYVSTVHGIKVARAREPVVVLPPKAA